MAKAGRIACIFTPYALSIGALICLILVGLGSIKPSAPESNIYFVRVSNAHALMHYKDLVTDCPRLSDADRLA